MCLDSLSLVFVGLLVWQGQEIGYSDDPAVAESIKVLHEVGIPHDGKSLVAFLQTRANGDVEAAALDALVKDLQSQSGDVRWRAAGKLVTYGSRAVPVLRAASRDEPTAVMARHCLAFVEGSQQNQVPEAVVTLLGVTQAPGAMEALLAYVPYAEDPAVDTAIDATLRQLAYRDGKPDPVLLKALDDENASKQIKAINALCRADRPDLFPKLRKLLGDKQPKVRLRTAEMLLEAKDASAVPVMIELLGEMPSASCKIIEEHLQTLAGDWRIKVPEGDDAISRKIRKECWQAWWKNMDGVVLLDELRKRTPSEEEQKNLANLIKQLNDEDAKIREQGTAALVRLGSRAVGVLQDEAASKDKDRAKRAENCLKLISDEDKSTAIPLRTCRLLALRKPDGTLKALLDFAPYAPRDFTDSDLLDMIETTGLADGKFNPLLIKTLEDESPQRRAIVAEVLSRKGGEAEFAAVRKLLKDPDTSVRARAALSLVVNGDKSSVPGVIELIKEKEWAGAAEEVLLGLAGDKAPKERVSDNGDALAKAQSGWEAWWKDNAGSVKVVRAKKGNYHGYLVVIQMDMNGTGEVVEWARDGSKRWSIGKLAFPTDAQVLPNDRVLIAEYNSSRVTERDTTGKIHWEKRTRGSPVSVQRFQNGNTLIATNVEVCEYDRNGKEIFKLPLGNLNSARRLPSGQIACMLTQGTVMILDKTGKEQRRFQVDPVTYTSSMQVTPQGHLLIAHYRQGKIGEYDLKGKSVWEAKSPRCNSAMRTPKNTTLVSSYDSSKLVELDRNGKEIWTYKEKNVRPWRAWRR